MRRRQRRLRSWWRHEQQTVAAVLATVTHHSHSKVGTANDAPRGQETVTSTRVGARPGSVTDPRPQVRVQRHTVDQMVDAPLPPTFDVPVPLMVEQLLLGVLSPLDFRVAEQVIEVPKILLDDVPERMAVRGTQLAEQLVEVPTPVSYSYSSQRSMEQIVDIPASVRGVSGSLQGFPQYRARRSGLRCRSLTFQFLAVEIFAVILVFSQNRVQQLFMFLRNAFATGLWSRSVLVETFLLVVQVLVSFARDRV